MPKHRTCRPNTVAICEQCGKEFAYYLSPARRPHRFCSPHCGNVHRGADTSGDQSPRFIGRIEKQCPTCGKTFAVTPKEAAARIHCSKPCWYLRNGTLADKLEKWVDKSGGPDACWEFVGARSPDGYGILWADGHHHIASRVAYELATGRQLGELHALHRCDNPPCCNPAHIFEGDNLANVKDKIAKKRQAKGRDLRRNVPTKLSAENVRKIRALAGTLTNAEIARRFAIDPAQVSRIIARQAWKDVP